MSAIHVGRQGKNAVVRVSDRGPGDAGEHARAHLRVVLPSARARRAGRRRRSGIERLVQQIARRHGGSVRCDGRDGGGSSFVLTVPVDEPAQTGGASAAGVSAGAPLRPARARSA